MTTLYRPVLIESEEQMGALPVGTIARGSMPHLVAVRLDKWWATLLSEYDDTSTEDLWGYWHSEGTVTALVPIEAEEETRPGNWFSPGGFFPEKLVYHPGATRLVTPWRDAR